MKWCLDYYWNSCCMYCVMSAVVLWQLSVLLAVVGCRSSDKLVLLRLLVLLMGLNEVQAKQKN